MSYRYVPAGQNYAAYAGGQIFYSFPGQPAFPIRLTRELFLRCLAWRETQGRTNPVVLFDPCCGSAYHLSVLGFLHGQHLRKLIAADIDPKALTIAERNLGLLTPAGLAQREQELAALLAEYGKPSHAAALEHLATLRQQLLSRTPSPPLTVQLFQDDATTGKAARQHLGKQTIDVVLTDVPYGQQTWWQISDDAAAVEQSPLWLMLNALLPHLTPSSIVAIAADKGQSPRHERYRRRDRFQIGKRRMTLLQPLF